MAKEQRLRTLIDKAIMGKGTSRPQLLGVGRVWYAPSVSDPGAYYLIGELLKVGPKHTTRQLVCSCMGFRMSAADKCRHVTSVEKVLDEKAT
jgi:hypothetical protein